jgi:hypothetical protein
MKCMHSTLLQDVGGLPTGEDVLLAGKEGALTGEQVAPGCEGGGC